MNMRYGIPILATLFLSCQSSPPVQRTGGAESAEDVAAIRTHSEAFDRAITAGNEQSSAELLTDDVIWMVPNQEALRGREAVRKRFRGLFTGLSLELHSTVDEVRIADDWAFVLGTYRLRLAPKDGGPSTDETGKLINILSRESNGTWRLARHIWNADHPER